MSLSLTRFLTVTFAAFLLAGCGHNHAAEDVVAEQTRLPAGTTVKLIEEDGDFALIETADAQRMFVNRSLLKTRNSAVQQTGEHTHVLSASATAHQEAPSALSPEKDKRTTAEISAEQNELNRLYLTEETLRRVIAPTSSGRLIDEVTGERCWPAYTCHNPECPRRRDDGEPHFFIFPTRGVLPICPDCSESFNITSMTHAQRIPYFRWTRPYVLPETARRIQELDAERRRQRTGRVKCWGQLRRL